MANAHRIRLIAEIDDHLIDAAGDFTKVVRKAENPVRRSSADNESIVLVRIAMELHRGAVHDHRRKESAIF